MNSNQIKEWRAEHALSQTELAGMLGVDVITVSRWERGIQTAPAFLELALETLNSQLKRNKQKGIKK